MPVKSRNIQAREKKNKKNPPGALRSERLGKDPQRPLPQTKGEGAVIQGKQIGKRLREEAGGSVEVKRMFSHDVTQWGLDLTPEQSQKAQEVQEEIQAQKKKPSFFEEPSAVVEGWTRGRTLGVAAGVAATAGIGLAVASVIRAGTALAATGGLSAPAIATTAAGRLAAATGYIKGAAAYAKTPLTTVAARKTITYLGKLVSGLKSPYVVLSILATGLYTSMFWAPNEKGDAMMTLGIIQGQALRNEDYETVLEIDEQMQEANDIAAGLPVIGFSQAEKAKFKAGITASETYAKQARKAMEDAEKEQEVDPNIAEAQARRAG